MLRKESSKVIFNQMFVQQVQQYEEDQFCMKNWYLWYLQLRFIHFRSFVDWKITIQPFHVVAQVCKSIISCVGSMILLRCSTNVFMWQPNKNISTKSKRSFSIGPVRYLTDIPSSAWMVLIRIAKAETISTWNVTKTHSNSLRN